MAKRILWKKGMRLTDEVLTLSDKCTEELVSNAFALGACGRMGLIPSCRKFSISLDINNDVIDVVLVDCLGLSRDGSLIDVQYDTNYTNTFDTRVVIPTQDTSKKYYLCISVLDGIRDTNDGMCESLYGFILVEENSAIPENALPIARILYDEFCWRSDENDFVPPCLYIRSHFKYEELVLKFVAALKEINSGLPQQLYTEKKDAVKVFWPLVQQIMISVDKRKDIMTPMDFLAELQKLVSAFYCACSLDDNIDISDPAQYVSFINTPYNYRNVYEIINKGVNLSLSINERIKAFSTEPAYEEHTSVPAPSISNTQLHQTVKAGNAQVKITNNAPGATIYYTIDGSTPTKSSKSGNTIVIDSGFTDDWHKEPPKNVTVKVVAYKDGAFSDVETYNVQIKKGNPFAGKQI